MLNATAWHHPATAESWHTYIHTPLPLDPIGGFATHIQHGVYACMHATFYVWIPLRLTCDLGIIWHRRTCTDECPQTTLCCWWRTHRGSPLLSAYTGPSWRCTPPDLQCRGCPAGRSRRQSQLVSCRSPTKRGEKCWHLSHFHVHVRPPDNVQMGQMGLHWPPLSLWKPCSWPWSLTTYKQCIKTAFISNILTKIIRSNGHLGISGAGYWNQCFAF